MALRLNDQRQLTRHASRTCEGGDLVACWLLSSAMVWPELPQMLSTDGTFEAVEPLQRKLASGENETFQDESYIDQRDIEELDDALIKLVK